MDLEAENETNILSIWYKELKKKIINLRKEIKIFIKRSSLLIETKIGNILILVQVKVKDLGIDNGKKNCKSFPDVVSCKKLHVVT